MARTYRALAALISYPTEALQAATGEIATVLAEEGLVPAPQRAAIDGLLAELAGRDIYDLQERYFALFDRSRTLSLHLFEHVHGESRDRGQAMADLIELYRGHGLEPTAGELPDFLPLFLEFVSLLPEDEARALLVEPAGILQVLSERLAARNSAYAAVFQALAILANAPDAPVPDIGLDIGQDDPDDLTALDAAWEEAAVHFGPGEQIDSCGTDRLRTRLRAATRDATAT
jgi:nitrate reductase molybdenum cofactor assembly chaperone NarJ/NarW